MNVKRYINSTHAGGGGSEVVLSKPVNERQKMQRSEKI